MTIFQPRRVLPLLALGGAMLDCRKAARDSLNINSAQTQLDALVSEETQRTGYTLLGFSGLYGVSTVSDRRHLHYSSSDTAIAYAQQGADKGFVVPIFKASESPLRVYQSSTGLDFKNFDVVQKWRNSKLYKETQHYKDADIYLLFSHSITRTGLKSGHVVTSDRHVEVFPVKSVLFKVYNWLLRHILC